MRKLAFSICENKGAFQLRGDRKADQRLCFSHTDSTILLRPQSLISSLWQSSVAEQPGLCQTWLETPKTGFLTWLKYKFTVAIQPPHALAKQVLNCPLSISLEIGLHPTIRSKILQYLKS